MATVATRYLVEVRDGWSGRIVSESEDLEEARMEARRISLSSSVIVWVREEGTTNVVYVAHPESS